MHMEIDLPVVIHPQTKHVGFVKFSALHLDIFFRIYKEKRLKMLFQGLFLVYFNKNGSSSKDFRAFLAYFLEKYVTLYSLYPRCANQKDDKSC